MERRGQLQQRLVEAVVWCSLAAIAYALATYAPHAPGQSAAPLDIDLHPSALPHYIGLSLSRMAAAYALSLVFTIVIGYLAAHNPIAGALVPPALDVLQSIPILSFLPAVLIAMLALVPGRVGLELGSIVLIFTGMVWNLTFSFYHSLLTVPRELTEASEMLGLSVWQRFATLELPVTLIGLIWNSVVSWAAGWFYLMASEAFTLAGRSYALPGLGSYLAVAADKGDVRAVLSGIAALVGVVVALDQLLWVPLVVWSRRFKIELAESEDSRRSWMLEALRRSRLLAWLDLHVAQPGGEWLTRRFSRQRSGSRLRMRILRSALTIAAAIVAAAAAYGIVRGTVSFIGVVVRIDHAEWLAIATGAAATCGRVGLTLVITLAWTLPAGIAIGTRAALSRRVQPIVQIAASVPATALFPVLLWVLLQRTGGLALASIILILLGTQWYVLFNVIAGANALPRDLQEASILLDLRGSAKWRTFYIPAIFPFLVTGGITAQGGAFNAAVVSEYVTFGGRIVQTTGLGAVIAAAAAAGNYPLLAASTVVMAALVVVINRLFWRRMARLAEERYHL